MKGRLPGALLLVVGCVMAVDGVVYIRRTFILNDAMQEVMLGLLLAYLGYAWMKVGADRRVS